MSSSDDFERVSVVVFGGFSGARYRAGRTCRILKRRFNRVLDASSISRSEFNATLASSSQPVWLLRAGVMPLDLQRWHLPELPSNGKAFCGFGLTTSWRSNTTRANKLLHDALNFESVSLDHECAEWKRLQAESGGDFSNLNSFSTQLPRASSVLLSAEFARELAGHLRSEQSFDAALKSALAAIPNRSVRLPQLDVVDDPALRVAEVVTSLQRGGAERVALDLTRELPRYGIRALFFALGAPTRSAFESPDSSVDFAPGRNRAEHVRNFAARAVALGCDAVHAHLLSAGDMALAKETGLPIIATVHNAKQGWPAGFVTTEKSFPVTLLAACSRAVECDVQSVHFGVPVRTIWNGIDAEAFKRPLEDYSPADEWRTKLELSSSDFVMLSLANPRPQKRLERLPAVLAALRAKFAKSGIERAPKLVIAGEASRSNEAARRSESALKAEIERFSLSDSIRLIGAAENIAPLLWACNVLISVSEWEGLSLAHLEALAAGRPVVATDAGGTSEIARENPALTIVPVDASPEYIAEKLAAIARTSGAQSTVAADASRARANLSFTFQTMAQRYASFFPRAIESARGALQGNGLWLIANNFTTGGAQSSARRLLLGMKAQNISVRSAVLQEREDHPTPGLSALRAAGVPVFIPESRSADPLDAVMQILEQIDNDPPRAVLFWNVIAEHKILLADAISDIPIFDVSPGEMFYDSFDLYFKRPRPGLPCLNAADYGARLAGMVIKYAGESARAESNLGIKPHVIPNGLPLDIFVPKAYMENGLFLIGTSARLAPQKKLEELIAALRLAAPRLPPHVLRIAGRPESGGDNYVQSLKDLGAGLNIEWIGEFQDSKTFLAGLDLFAMISEPAGCPNASLEAMAAGLPIIATDHGGASEQVIDGLNGRLVPRANASKFADALVELAHNSALRMAYGAASRERAEAHFSLTRMVADYRQLCGI